MALNFMLGIPDRVVRVYRWIKTNDVHVHIDLWYAPFIGFRCQIFDIRRFHISRPALYLVPRGFRVKDVVATCYNPWHSLATLLWCVSQEGVLKIAGFSHVRNLDRFSKSLYYSLVLAVMVSNGYVIPSTLLAPQPTPRSANKPHCPH